MKRAKVIVILILVCYSFSHGQSKVCGKQHFIELNQFITGSGFTSSAELCFKIGIDDKKTLAIGTFYCFDTDKISGITFRHEIRIFRGKAIMNNNLRPYAFYNMIYRKTSVKKSDDDNSIGSNEGKYTSMEHHLGIGTKIFFSKSLFINVDLGFGPYLGSIKKSEILNQYSGEIAGTNGFGMLIKFGFGYSIF